MKKKKWICLLLAAVCLRFAVPAFAAGGSGDVNGDGTVTAEDARRTLRFAVLLDAPTTWQRTAADADGDGYITAADARVVLRKAVGLEMEFESVLYGVAHRWNRKTAGELPPVDHLVENVYRSVGKWCCYYTIHDVFRPALKQAGYSQERIDLLAPNRYDPEKVNTAMMNATSVSLPAILRPLLFGTNSSVYIPSLLADYYRTHPRAAETYQFYPYYDDLITLQDVPLTINRLWYAPRVGDILFVSNKTSTYVDGKPTIDHTAQIIRVYENGVFLCTDGCVMDVEGIDAPCVGEREYVFNAARGTYEYKKNPGIVVLMIARPAL